MWKMKFQFSHFFKKFNFLKSAKKVWKKGGTSFSLFFKGSWSLTPHLAVIRANLDKCLFLSLNAITARSRKWRYYSPRTACFSLGALQGVWGSRGSEDRPPGPDPQNHVSGPVFERSPKVSIKDMWIKHTKPLCFSHVRSRIWEISSMWL